MAYFYQFTQVLGAQLRVSFLRIFGPDGPSRFWSFTVKIDLIEEMKNNSTKEILGIGEIMYGFGPFPCNSPNQFSQSFTNHRLKGFPFADKHIIFWYWSYFEPSPSIAMVVVVVVGQEVKGSCAELLLDFHWLVIT